MLTTRNLGEGVRQIITALIANPHMDHMHTLDYVPIRTVPSTFVVYIGDLMMNPASSREL